MSRDYYVAACSGAAIALTHSIIQPASETSMYAGLIMLCAAIAIAMLRLDRS